MVSLGQNLDLLVRGHVIESDETKTRAWLNPAQCDEVLKNLDQLDPVIESEPEDHSTRPTRWPFRSDKVTIDVEHPAGGFGRYDSYSRCLSATSASLIIRSFLHVNTAAKLTLPTIGDGHESIRCKVVSCRHVQLSFHEIVVDFLESVDLGHFLDIPRHQFEQVQEVDPSTLAGRILLLISYEAELQLMKHYLDRTQISYDVAHAVADALNHVKTSLHDLIICDLEFDEHTAEQLVPLIRESGFTGAFVVLAGDICEQRTRSVTDAGAHEIIKKPFTGSTFLNAVATLLEDSGVDGGPDAVYSELSDDDEMTELILWYVDYVKGVLKELQHAIDTDNLRMARLRCEAIKETGVGYGYPTVSQAAHQAITELDASQSIAESLTELKNLDQLCRCLQLRP